MERTSKKTNQRTYIQKKDDVNEIGETKHKQIRARPKKEREKMKSQERMKEKKKLNPRRRKERVKKKESQERKKEEKKLKTKTEERKLVGGEERGKSNEDNGQEELPMRQTKWKRGKINKDKIN